MISTEEFLARAEEACEQRAKASERNEQLFKELQALCALTSMSVSRSGDAVMVYGVNSEPIISGPIGDVVEALVESPSDVPFGLFTKVPVELLTKQATEVEAPIHIERRDFTLITELAECLSEYLGTLA